MTKDDLKITITPEDIYGPGWEEDIPPGWEVDRFGIAESWEPILARPARNQDLLYRIILRKTKVKKIVFTQFGIRVPRPGDYYLAQDGLTIVFRDLNDTIPTTTREVYTREDIEEYLP